MALVLTSGVLLGAAGPARAVGEEEAARRASHLLDYIAVDYPEAVRDGEVISDLEYREQLEFAGTVGEQLARLGLVESDPLREQLASLLDAIRKRQPAPEIATHSRALSRAIRERFAVRALPPRTPDLERGAHLYTQICGSCHGPLGRGDGPAGLGLEPPPTDFTDLDRALLLSPLALYSTISFGIAGTGMVSYADAFDEAGRHDLAFYVGSLAFDPALVERGRALAEREPQRVSDRVPDLASLVQTPAGELAQDKDGRAVVAFVRVHPEFLQHASGPVQRAKRRLDESWGAYTNGDSRLAIDLAVAGYIEDFEPLEPSLNALDRELRISVEQDFMRYRALIRAGASRAELEPVYAALSGLLDAVERRLAKGDLGPAAIFTGALAIVAREGLEAVLVVVALIGVLVRANRRDALRWVHRGWVAALVAGAATWYAAQGLVRVTGAQREVIEGISSLIATAILFYVSYWFVSNLATERWQTFLHDRLSTALGRGNFWALTAVSFVAVYRELLETVLFFQALSAQAGPGGLRPLLLGIVAGAALLALLATLILRFGLRLPMRAFFGLSSALLYTLAVVLAGQGVAALQEVDWLPATVITDLRVEWLGIHGTLEGLALQGVLVAAALATIPRLLSVHRERIPAE